MIRNSPCAALLLIVLAGRAPAVAPEVKDDGKFFGPEAVKKANEQVREIARKYERDLLVETFAAVPAEQADKVKALGREERAKFFDTWARERAERAVVNGVYVLICKEPPYVQVELSPKPTPPLDAAFRSKLRDLLVEEFRQKRYDDGLLAAVKLVRDKLAGPSK